MPELDQGRGLPVTWFCDVFRAAKVKHLIAVGCAWRFLPIPKYKERGLDHEFDPHHSGPALSLDRLIPLSLYAVLLLQKAVHKKKPNPPGIIQRPTAEIQEVSPQ